MRAVVLDYASRTLRAGSVPDPGPPAPGEVLLRIHHAGVCGTDRELAAFRIGYPAEGSSTMVLGHEALGRVIETGSGVATLRRGDWVVPMVRRACRPPCEWCARGRRDFCVSGGYKERGIFGLDGYFADFAV